MLSKSLIQFPFDGRGYVPSLLFDLRPNYPESNEDNGNFLQKIPCMHCHTQCPNPAAGHHRLTPLSETPGHAQASLGQSLVGSFLLGPAQGFLCAFQEFVSLALCKLCQLYGGVNGNLLQRAYAIPRSTAPRMLPLRSATAGLYLCKRHSNTQRQVCPSLCGVS